MYSEFVLEHFGNPRNAGRLEGHNSKGVAGNPNAGPFMVLYLDVQDGVVARASFQTYGCAAAIAAGSVISEMVKGKTLDEASTIDAGTLIALLAPLPLGKEQCAHLAVSALADAIRNRKLAEPDQDAKSSNPK